MTPALRIGILLDRMTLPAWQCQIIENLKSMDGLNVEIILTPPVRTTGWEKLIQWPFSVYEALDQFLFSKKAGTRNALKMRDITHEISAHELKPADYFDVLINMTRMPKACAAWCSSARYGVWTVVHGDMRQYGGLPPYFWEVNDRAVTSGSTVLMQKAPGIFHPLYHSYAKTHPYSLFLSRNAAYWKSTAFLPRCLAHLMRYGEASSGVLEPATGKECFPHAGQMAIFLGRITLRFLKDKWEKKRYRYQYQIGFRRREQTLTHEHLAGLCRMKPPQSEFWADPFLIRHDNSNYLFFENFPYDTARGIISYTRLGENGQYTPPQTALERDYHLSYPFFIRDNGTLYMMPETSGNGTIELFKAVEFPHRWELAKTLMQNVNAQDATIIQHNGLYWLFANLVVAGGAVNDELFLFYSDSLLGDWTPHPKNPVISDVSRARPAGNLFHKNGELIRPSQDCSKRYGYAINFNRVDILTREDYRESLVHKLCPDGFENYLGIHTYNANEDFEVIDMARHIPLN